MDELSGGHWFGAALVVLGSEFWPIGGVFPRAHLHLARVQAPGLSPYHTTKREVVEASAAAARAEVCAKPLLAHEHQQGQRSLVLAVVAPVGSLRGNAFHVQRAIEPSGQEAAHGRLGSVKPDQSSVAVFLQRPKLGLE